MEGTFIENRKHSGIQLPPTGETSSYTVGKQAKGFGAESSIRSYDGTIIDLFAETIIPRDGQGKPNHLFK